MPLGGKVVDCLVHFPQQRRGEHEAPHAFGSGSIDQAPVPLLVHRSHRVPAGADERVSRGDDVGHTAAGVLKRLHVEKVAGHDLRALPAQSRGPFRSPRQHPHRTAGREEPQRHRPAERSGTTDKKNAFHVQRIT